MTSRHTTIQSKQLATVLGACVVATSRSWTPGSNISNLFEPGYDPEKRVLEVTS